MRKGLWGAITLSFVAWAAFAGPAQRIVTLAPNLTELVYTAGAGGKLVGVEAYSDYPEQAKRLPRIGDAFQIDYERLLSLEPDLVLVWDAGTPEPVIEKLQRLHLHVQRISISRLEEIAPAIRDIGKWAGTAAVAEPAANEYSKKIASLKAGRAQAVPVTVFYQISERPLYTVNGEHLISEVIQLCGGKNIFDDLSQLAPPVSLEAVLERDPQVIVTANGAQGDPLALWKKWPKLKAVKHRNLYTVDADSLARSTTRVVDGIRQMCSILDEARRKSR